VEVWPVMRCTNFWKHTDDDPKEARDFRHGLLYIVVGDSRRANGGDDLRRAGRESGLHGVRSIAGLASLPEAGPEHFGNRLGPLGGNLQQSPGRALRHAPPLLPVLQC
jgi:hypothetical protein